MRFSRRERRAYLDRYVRSESRGRGTENQPTGHGPKGWLEKGPSASLFVRYVSHRICSSLTPRIQTLLKPTVCLLLMTRCTRHGVVPRAWPARRRRGLRFPIHIDRPVVKDLIPDREFHLSEAGPFDNQNSSSFVQPKFFRFSHGQILHANLVPFAGHVDSVHLFQ